MGGVTQDLNICKKSENTDILKHLYVIEPNNSFTMQCGTFLSKSKLKTDPHTSETLSGGH